MAAVTGPDGVLPTEGAVCGPNGFAPVHDPRGMPADHVVLPCRVRHVAAGRDRRRAKGARRGTRPRHGCTFSSSLEASSADTPKPGRKRQTQQGRCPMERSSRRFVITVPATVFASVSMALAVSTASAVAQAIAPEDAPLQGFVADELTGEVITSARVTIMGTEMETRTDEAGTFAFADPPLGDVSLRVQAEGYPVVVDKAEVRPDEVVYVYVRLPQVQIVLGELRIVARGSASEDEAEGLHGAQTAAHLLARQVPGLTNVDGIVGQMGNDHTIVLRGQNSILNSEPVVLLDGIRLTRGLLGAMEALTRIPAEQVLRIRVLRGPAAAFIQGEASGAIVVETGSRYDEGR